LQVKLKDSDCDKENAKARRKPHPKQQKRNRRGAQKPQTARESAKHARRKVLVGISLPADNGDTESTRLPNLFKKKILSTPQRPQIIK